MDMRHGNTQRHTHSGRQKHGDRAHRNTQRDRGGRDSQMCIRRHRDTKSHKERNTEIHGKKTETYTQRERYPWRRRDMRRLCRCA